MAAVTVASDPQPADQQGADENDRSVQVLAICGEEYLRTQLRRLAAAAGVRMSIWPDAETARCEWPVAKMVLLDAAAAAACAHGQLPRRPGVFVLCDGEADAQTWQAALAVGAEQVHRLPEAEAEVIDALGDAREPPAEGGGVLAIVGGTGGAGASLLSALTAVRAARRGRNAMLVDLDPLGGGLDLTAACEERPGARWNEIGLRAGRVAATALHEVLPSTGIGAATVSTLACNRDTESELTPGAVAAVLESGRRAGELVICDLPRATPPSAVAALQRADLVLLVVPALVRGCAAAASMARRLAAVGTRPQLVVRGPAPGGLTAADVSSAVGAPALVSWRRDARLEARIERGELPVRGRGQSAATADAVLQGLAGVLGQARGAAA